MTEVKEGSRKGWGLHKRNNSTLGGGATASPPPSPMVERKDVALQKAPSTRGKGTGRGWMFPKGKKGQSKAVEEEKAAPAEEQEEGEEERESKSPSVQRVVQGLYPVNGPSPKILQTSQSAARDAIKEFSREFITQLKKNPEGWAAMEDQMRKRFALDAGFPQSDVKYLVQAFIAHLLFVDFENASFGIRNPGERPWEVQQHMVDCFEQFNKYNAKSQTVSKLVENDVESFLSKFCLNKYAALVASDATGGTFPPHPENTPFYRSFLGAAVSVWLLQRLAFSFEQKIRTVYPTGGDAYKRRFMEPVVPGIGDTEDENCDVDLEILFTVFPGFRVSDSIVLSSVYIVERPKAAGAPSPAVEVETESAKESPVDDHPDSSSGVEPVEKKPSKQTGRFAEMKKMLSFPGKRSEKDSAAIKGSQKSSSGSLNDGSTNKPEPADKHETSLVTKMFKRKFTAWKKKDKVAGDEASSTVDPAEATTPATLPSSEEVPPVLTSSSLEAAAPSSSLEATDDSKQDMDSAVPGERQASSSLEHRELAIEPSNAAPELVIELSNAAPELANEPSNAAPELANEPSNAAPELANEPSNAAPELVNKPSNVPELALDDEKPLYTTRAEKNAQPRLSSVD